MAVLDHVRLLAYNPGVHPKGGGLPGLTVLRDSMGSMNLFAIIGTVGALSLSAAVWAWGHITGGHNAEEKGKNGVRISAGVALLLGAANGIVAFFSSMGSGVH